MCNKTRVSSPSPASTLSPQYFRLVLDQADRALFTFARGCRFRHLFSHPINYLIILGLLPAHLNPGPGKPHSPEHFQINILAHLPFSLNYNCSSAQSVVLAEALLVWASLSFFPNEIGIFARTLFANIVIDLLGIAY